MPSTSFNIYTRFRAVRTEQNLDHNCCWVESPWDTPFRQNAKTVFSCRAFNSITVDSTRATPGTVEAKDRDQIMHALRP